MSNEGLKLEYKRYYVAKKPDGSWVKCSWTIEEKHRYINAQGVYISEGKKYDNLPFEEEEVRMGRAESVTITLNYDLKLWESLKWLTDQIGIIRNMISKTISSVPGRAMLVNTAQKSLPLMSIQNDL